MTDNRTCGHRNFSRPVILLGPSEKLMEKVRSYPTIQHAARELGVSPATLKRFIEEGEGITGNTVAVILDRTGMSYRQAFVHKTLT